MFTGQVESRFFNIQYKYRIWLFVLGPFEPFVSEPPLYSRKIHVSVKEFQEFMKTSGENEHPLETLEALLEVICVTEVFSFR